MQVQVSASEGAFRFIHKLNNQSQDGKPRDEMEQAAVLHRFVCEVEAGGTPESQSDSTNQGDGS